MAGIRIETESLGTGYVLIKNIGVDGGSGQIVLVKVCEVFFSAHQTFDLCAMSIQVVRAGIPATG